MGSECRITCNECNYTKAVPIGIGMQYSPDNIINMDSEFNILSSLIKSKKTVAEITDLVKNHDAKLVDNYSHSLYHCSKCSEFFGRFFLQLKHSEGIFEPEYKCTKCRTSLDFILSDSENEHRSIKEGSWGDFNCPECGKNSLYQDYEFIVDWD